MNNQNKLPEMFLSLKGWKKSNSSHGCLDNASMKTSCTIKSGVAHFT
jgi:hypothetical protein